MGVLPSSVTERRKGLTAFSYSYLPIIILLHMNNNTTASSAGFTPVTFSILAVLLLILVFLIVLIALQLKRASQQQEELQARRLLFLQQRQQRPDLEERILRRYETIEHWLITKQVVAHDPVFCKRVLHELLSRTITNEHNHTTVHSPLTECPICMNGFHAGDIVSWSANPSCCHVYHHECLKEWLLRRTHCPYCRETVLPCDFLVPDKTPAQLQEWSQLYANQTSRTYCCVYDGLVTLPLVLQCTGPELQQLKERIFDAAVRPEDLVQLRGERQEGTIHSLSKEEDDLPDIEDASEKPFLESSSLQLSRHESLEVDSAVNTNLLYEEINKQAENKHLKDGNCPV